MAPVAAAQVIIQGIGFVASAVALKTYLDQEAAMTPPSSNLCPTCSGTRRVPCLCSRWSDGDVGCSTCGGSGNMTCSSCGGSGTGRPLPARLHISRSQTHSSSSLRITRQ
eukprot:jgi/Mesen1/6437/ME000033S05725